MFKIFNSKKRFPASLFILSLSLLIVGGGFSARPAWAETQEEKAQREADKKAAEAKKKLEEMHKKAEESIDYKFDKFKASTVIGAGSEKVRSQSEVFSLYGDLFLDSRATVEGEVKAGTRPDAAPDTVRLFFSARAQHRRTMMYQNTQELRLLVDGKPMGPYPVKCDAEKDGDVWLESMRTEMPFADFKKMVDAGDSMEGRLGKMEFKFNDYVKILYLTFLGRISPAEQ